MTFPGAISPPIIPESRMRGVRYCCYVGCPVYGSSTYMDGHEAETHVLCSCGWIGSGRNHRRHMGQRARQWRFADGKAEERRRHRIMGERL